MKNVRKAFTPSRHIPYNCVLTALTALVARTPTDVGFARLLAGRLAEHNYMEYGD